MKDELFDIIDENNQDTGKQEMRSVAHANGLWHRTVHIYLFRRTDTDYELLVHLRAKNKDSSPNKWDPRFGGHVKAGESLQQAAINELMEETGLIAELDNLVVGSVHRHDGGLNKEYISNYFYNFMGDLAQLTIDTNEVQAIKWLRESDIRDYMKAEPHEWVGNLGEFDRFILELKSACA